MKTKEQPTNNQPKHTQAKQLRILRNEKKEDGLFIYGDSNEKAIARIYPHENQEEYAKRIVKAVNMHDELVEFMKKLYVEYMFGQYNQASVLGINDEMRDKFLSQNSIVIKYKELLKQAEGK